MGSSPASTGTGRPASTVLGREPQPAYLDARGRAVLATLDDIAARHGCSVTAVALAWLGIRPQVSGVIASARNTEQLDALIEASRVRLSEADVNRLDAVS